VVSRIELALLSGWTLAAIAPVVAQPNAMALDINAGSLPHGLQTLERQTGIELLFDRALISDLQAPAVRGELTTEVALRRLLAGTNLTVRRAESGAWIVEPPDHPPLARLDAVIPEIMVLGRRTQNVDIHRFENDVQPYTVATKAEIRAAHRDNVDQFFISRITSNTQAIPAGLTQSGTTLSEINLRGLGSRDTLVLIDGRRMPSVPISAGMLQQSDVNGVPLHAIERIEVLTGAAGGIYGYGALGGVVNVVLDRDSRGLDLYVTGGISSRGDAERQMLEASYGHTSQDGRTDVTVFASHSREGALLVGQRSYEARDRRLSEGYVGSPYLTDSPHGNSISVFSTGENLEFKPEFGGDVLASNHTYLPLGFAGDAGALVAPLTQHAGQFDTSLPQDKANGDLGSNPRADSLLMNVRHRFSTRIEAYADVAVLRSRGHSSEPGASGQALMSPDSPANPFNNLINVYFPLSGMGARFGRRIENSRYTAGVVSELPWEWRGTLEASWGRLRNSAAGTVAIPNRSYLILLGDPSDLDLNPFGNWEDLQATLVADQYRYALSYINRNRFRNDSLRLAGPVFNTAAGPATLTLLGERRTEHIPTATRRQTTQDGGVTTIDETADSARSSAVTSLYAELRSLLFATDAAAPLLRGLELQLAIRRDDQKDDFARRIFSNEDGGQVQARFAGTAYTAGAKITPLPWLMLRGSYSTGEQPPDIYALREDDEQMLTLPLATDPKRGGTTLGVEGEYLLKSGGNADLTAVRASTMFLGTVITPFGQDGARLAVDFSRIRKTRDVLVRSPDSVIAQEDFWPERVTRAPLTDADAAQGYTAGRVIALDTRAENGAGLEVDAFDAHALWPLPFSGSRLRLYADATYHMSNRTTALLQPHVQSAGYFEGPLRWRANGGVDWSMNGLTIGANLQYFGSRLVTVADQSALYNEIRVKQQGSRHIPSQSYLDLHASWDLPLPLTDSSKRVTVDVGIVNVLDKTPPRETSLLIMGAGYSRYGDPRQRRFELVLSADF